MLKVQKIFQLYTRINNVAKYTLSVPVASLFETTSYTMFKPITVLIALSAMVYFYINSAPPTVPVLPEIVWKRDGSPIEDEKIHPFSIETSPETVKNLKNLLRNTTLPHAPLSGVNFEYGFNANHLRKIIDFWINDYEWEERKRRLNSVPHFRTKISGLRIHFVRVQPDPKQHKLKKVIPLLLLHGWPGSVKEFYALFSRLTQPRAQYDFVFDVIAPSLPGYGFSDAAELPGMNAAHIGLVMKKLMNRLGFKKFYVQGGDWGSMIGSSMATLFPDSVIGYHTNMCPGPLSLSGTVKLFLSSFYPSFFVENELFRRRIYPLSNYFSYLLEESGYLHLQATKPDTVGVALTNSPAGLAAYILEKFSTWTNYNWRKRADGGLNLDVVGKGDKYTIEDLLDNVMIYWISNSITTSMRLYSEQLSAKTFALQLDSIPTNVPTACANYPYDIAYSPEFIVRSKFHNLVHFEHMPRGGHFAAFEEPELFANDVWKAVCKIENVANEINSKC